MKYSAIAAAALAGFATAAPTVQKRAAITDGPFLPFFQSNSGPAN